MNKKNKNSISIQKVSSEKQNKYDFQRSILYISFYVSVLECVRVFDYIQQKQICDARFPSGGTSILWAPQLVSWWFYLVFVSVV